MIRAFARLTNTAGAAARTVTAAPVLSCYVSGLCNLVYTPLARTLTAAPNLTSRASMAAYLSGSTQYFNAMTDGAVGDRCINNGSTDDLAHLTAQANAAKAAGKALYLPPGAGYYISSAWTPPSNLTVVGAGGLNFATHILGQVNPRSNSTFTGVDIGVSTARAMRLLGESPGSNVTFNNCRFRGGTAGPVIQEGNAYGKYFNVTFNYCVFEVARFTSFTPLAHSVSIQVDCDGGGTFDGLTFDHCHFGYPNQYGQTENLYGQLLYYRHGANPDGPNGYLNNLYVRNCIFEKAWNWGIDYTGNDDAGTRIHPLEYQHFECTNNLFKGGGGHTGETYEDFPLGIDMEPCYHSTVSGNVFFKYEHQPCKATFDSHYVDVSDNVFDFRVDNGITPRYPGGGWNDYMHFRVIHFLGGTNQSATGNTLYLPAAYAAYGATNNSWIQDDADDTSYISGNHVYFNDNTPPDYESIMDVGPW